MNFDELNALITNPRSEPYARYFGDMEISEAQRKERIALAEAFEEAFLPILIYMFTMRQYRTDIDWNRVVERFDAGYREAAKNFLPINEYMDLHIRSFAYDMVDSTQDHLDDPYYYSLDRARFSSENESNTTLNYKDFQSAVQAGKTRKIWVDVRDNRERETHLQVGGTVKPIGRPFVVGDSLMMFPHDALTFGASPSEYLNCRCSIRYF